MADFSRTRREFSLANLANDVSDYMANWSDQSERARQQQSVDSYSPYQAPGGLPYSNKYDPQENPSEFLRALMTEIDGVRAPIRPGFPVEGFDAPSPTGWGRPKSVDRLHKDYQQMQWMDRLLSAYGKPESPTHTPEKWSAFDRAYGGPRGFEKAQRLRDTLRAYAADSDKYRSGLRSMTEKTGVFDNGSPVNTFMNWGQSVPSMLYGVGENVSELGDWATSKALGIQPRPSRPTNFMQALNTFSAPGQFLAGAAGYAMPVPDDHSAWSAMDAVRRNFDANDRHDTAARFYAPNIDGVSIQDSKRAASRQWELQASPLIDGREYLTRQGAPAKAALWGGALTDSLFNPFLDVQGIVGASRHLPKLAPMAVQLAEEFGLDAAMAAATQRNEAEQIRRLKEEAARE